MKNKKMTYGIAIGLILALVLATVALADTVAPDNDFVTAGNQITISLGIVAPGATLTPQVSFQLVCAGNKHVDSSQSVNLSYTTSGSSAPAGGSITSATSASIGAIAATWPDDGNNVCTGQTPVNDNGNSTVTLVAPMAVGGPYIYVVKYNAALSPAGSDDSSSVSGSSQVTFTLSVAPSDSTPPVITPTIFGTLGNNGWYTSNVALSWTVSDPDSTVISTTGCGATSITSDQNSTNYTCSATSAGGINSVTVSIKRDATAPAVTVSPGRGPDNGTWYNAPVDFSTTGTDGFSGIASCSALQTYSGPGGTNLSVSGSCTDLAGNSGTASSPLFNYDGTNPVVTITPNRSPDFNGWYTASVNFGISGTDTGGSGVATCTPTSISYSGPDSATAQVSASCTDNAGNTGTGVYNFKYDTSAPTVTVSPARIPDQNGWYNAPVVFDTTGSDGVSGVLDTNCSADVNYTAPDGQALTVPGQCTDNAGNVGYGTSAAFDFDDTNPTISAAIAPPVDPSGWWNSTTGAPTVTYTCGDVTSLVASCTTPYTFGEGADQFHDGTAVDNAGNSASTGVSNIDVDLSAPTVTVSPARIPDQNGWYNAPVVFDTTGSDGVSGVLDANCSADVNYTAPDGQALTVPGQCTDNAGNVGYGTSAAFDFDDTNPSVTVTPDRVSDHNGWYNHPVIFTTSGTDGISGIALCDTTQIYSAPDGQALTVSGSCTDNAGNTASADSAAFDFDDTNPVLNIVGPASGGFGVCAIPAEPDFGPTDNLSGIDTSNDSWTPSTTPSGVGSYVYSATATDVAGNTTSETRTYNVTYGSAFDGFYQPINMDGTSRIKITSTVPMKFALSCNGVPITNATAFMWVSKDDGTPDPGIDEAISTSAATTGNLFRLTGTQYIFNLSTKLGYLNPGSSTPTSFTPGSWRFTAKLDDGTYRTVVVQLRK